jgi:hypothetical protein
MDQDTKDQYERVANMVAMGVSNFQVAEAMGLSEGRISQILGEDDFKVILAERYMQDQKRNSELNGGWDELEQTALGVLKKNMKYNMNPEFALRAAAVANKAQRRGAVGNTPLPAQMGHRVVISLKQVFVDKLQSGLHTGAMKNVTPTGAMLSTSENKKVNLLSPGETLDLLAGVVEEKDIVIDAELGLLNVG